MATPLERVRSRVLLTRIGRHGSQCFIASQTMIEHGENMTFGDRVLIGRFNRLGTVPLHVGQKRAPRLTIESGVSTEWFTHIACADRVRIGAHTLIAGRVFISDHDHGFRTADLITAPALWPLETAPVDIGERCWIGEGVCVLPGVTVGDECVIGAGSVVTKNLPPRSVAVGVPARVVRQRAPSDGIDGRVDSPHDAG